ncbi:MAG: MbnP family protein [Saprospiraceae bacterium]
MSTALKYKFDLLRWSGMKCTLLFALICLITSCHKSDDESTGTINLSFTSHFGAEQFSALKPYSYFGNQSIKFSKFDFYITGIQLISSSEILDIDQHALIDLTSSATGDQVLTLRDIKSGEYTAIKLAIGVIPSLNKKQPKDFNSSDVLSSTSHYWDAWNSFIFSKIEGVIDTGGTKTFDLGFAVHTGTDQCLQTLTIPKSFAVIENNEIVIHLDVDIKTIFTVSGQFFDLTKSPLNHNPTNIETLTSFSERMANSIQLKN